MRALCFALVVGLTVASALSAQSDPNVTARQASQMLQDAAESLRDAASARDRVAALSQTVQAYEQGLNAMRAGMRQAAVQERTILALLEAERERISRLLGLLSRIERTPVPATVLHPEGPLGTARLGMLLADVTPAVANDALLLRNQLEELSVLRALQESSLSQMEQGLIGVTEARSALSQAIADRVDPPARFDSDPEAMRMLAQSVDSLDNFADLLTRRGSLAEPTGFAEAEGRLPLPVLGGLLRSFNEPDAAGIRRPGLLLATENLALVTAPWPATVRYAGTLLDYGNVIILEPGSDYLMVLAGLGDLYVRSGELVDATAPLGLMPGPATMGGSALISQGTSGAGGGLTETLYIELRREGVPFDPAPWFGSS